MVEQFSHLGVPSEVLEALDDVDIERYVWRHAVLPDPVVGQCLGGGNSRRGVHVEHLANEILGLGSDLGPRVSLEVLLQARLGRQLPVQHGSWLDSGKTLVGARFPPPRFHTGPGQRGHPTETRRTAHF